jgi:hypothetical protein
MGRVIRSKNIGMEKRIACNDVVPGYAFTPQRQPLKKSC